MNKQIKHFLGQCMWFSLTIAAILLLIELVVRVFVPNPYKTKHRWMCMNACRVETIVLGSSHTFYGVDPALLDGVAFNLANTSQTFRYDYTLLLKYAPYPNLRQVILPVSYFSFFDPDLQDDDTALEFVPNYKLYMHIDSLPALPVYNFEICRPAVLRVKLFSPNSTPQCDSLGHGTNFLAYADSSALSKTCPTAVSRHTAPDFRHVNQNVFYFTKIADWCKTNNVRLILVTTPAWKDYRDNLDTAQFNKFISLRDSLANKYNLTVLDYFSDPRFKTIDFYDADHLSSNYGAQKLTRILNSDIKATAR